MRILRRSHRRRPMSASTALARAGPDSPSGRGGAQPTPGRGGDGGRSGRGVIHRRAETRRVPPPGRGAGSHCRMDEPARFQRLVFNSDPRAPASARPRRVGAGLLLPSAPDHADGADPLQAGPRAHGPGGHRRRALIARGLHQLGEHRLVDAEERGNGPAVAHAPALPGNQAERLQVVQALAGPPQPVPGGGRHLLDRRGALGGPVGQAGRQTRQDRPQALPGPARQWPPPLPLERVQKHVQGPAGASGPGTAPDPDGPTHRPALPVSRSGRGFRRQLSGVVRVLMHQ